jgi:hypothetical protein
MDETQLDNLSNLFFRESIGTDDDKRRRIQNFLTQINYQGLQTYEELAKPENLQELVDSAERVLMRRVLPGSARDIEEIQDLIPLYNPENELKIELENFVARKPVGSQDAHLQDLSKEIDDMDFGEEAEANAASNSHSPSECYFAISIPEDFSRFRRCLEEIKNKYPKKGIERINNQQNELVPEYYFNQVESSDDFHDLIKDVLEQESCLIKLTYGFVIIVENRQSEQEDPIYSVISSKENKEFSIPITINLVNSTKENEQKLHDYLDSQIDKMLQVRIDNMTSSTRFIGITNFAIYVSRMRAVGGKEFPIPRKIMTSKNVVIYKAGKARFHQGNYPGVLPHHSKTGDLGTLSELVWPIIPLTTVLNNSIPLNSFVGSFWN